MERDALVRQDARDEDGLGTEPAQDDRVHRIDAGREWAGTEPEREIEGPDRHEREQPR